MRFLIFLGYALTLLHGIVGRSPLDDSCVNGKCCFDESEWPRADNKRFRCQAVNGSYPCAIKLGVNSWQGSFINVYVASIFIEEFLGYPVEIQADFSSFSGTVTESDMFQFMEDGLLDAILEVWPSGHQEHYREYIQEKGTVIDAGALGPVGQIGWFTPSSHLTASQSGLEYWRNLQDPENAQYFADPQATRTCCISDVYSEMRDVFPCMPSAELGGTPVENGGMATSADCDDDPSLQIPTYGGRYIAGAQDWVQYDDQIIRNLGLNLTIEYVGSEANLVRELNNSHHSNQPAIAYFWKPHALFRLLNLSMIILPEFNPECYDRAGDGGVDCGYPRDNLYKVFSARVERDYPDLAVFLRTMRFRDSSQQEAMLADIFMNPEKPIKEVACDWVKANNQTWTAWTKPVELRFVNKTWNNEVLEKRTFACACDAATNERKIMYGFSETKFPNLASFSFQGQDACSENATSTYSSRWFQHTYPTFVERSGIPCSSISPSSNAATIIMTTFIVSIVYLGVLLALFVIKRKSVACMAAGFQTQITHIFGGACILSAFVNLIGEPTNASCALRVACLVYGFSLFAGSLLLKVYLLRSAMLMAGLKKKGRIQKHVQTILRFQSVLLAAVASVLFFIWAAAVGFVPVKNGNRSEDLRKYNIEELTCPSSTTGLGVIGLVFFSVLVVTCLLAQEVRSFKGSVFGEAQFAFFSAYNLSLTSLIVLGFQVVGSERSDVASALSAVTAALGVVITVSLITGSRVYAAWSGAKVEAVERLSSNATSSAVTSSDSN